MTEGERGAEERYGVEEGDPDRREDSRAAIRDEMDVVEVCEEEVEEEEEPTRSRAVEGEIAPEA